MEHINEEIKNMNNLPVFTDDLSDQESWLAVYQTRVDRPEQRLCRAVLEQAIADINDPKYGPKAVDWIRGVEPEEGMLNLNFEFVCLMVGFSSASVVAARERLLKRITIEQGGSWFVKPNRMRA